MIASLPPAQVTCIAEAVYHEARGESDRGKRAIAHVVLNRSKHRGMTPCKVIRQKGQFSFRLKKHHTGKVWKKCYKIAKRVKYTKDPTRGARYFHNLKVHPHWSRSRITVRIGHHIFYK